MTHTMPPKRKIRMIPTILICIGLIIAIFLVIVALRSPDYRVTRSATINAAPSVVFPLVNDFHRWEAWSPWAKMDPAAKNTFSGADSGTGAVFAWEGNNKVGQGKMTLIDSHPNESLKIQLEFIKPMPGTSLTEFTFVPNGNQTLVTWTMTGKSSFIAKAFCMFMNMDKMVGGDFERGLAGIKSVAEGNAK